MSKFFYFFLIIFQTASGALVFTYTPEEKESIDSFPCASTLQEKTYKALTKQIKERGKDLEYEHALRYLSYQNIAAWELASLSEQLQGEIAGDFAALFAHIDALFFSRKALPSLQGLEALVFSKIEEHFMKERESWVFFGSFIPPSLKEPPCSYLFWEKQIEKIHEARKTVSGKGF